MAKWTKQKGLGISNMMTEFVKGLEIVVNNELETLQKKLGKLEQMEKMKKDLKNG